MAKAKIVNGFLMDTMDDGFVSAQCGYVGHLTGEILVFHSESDALAYFQSHEMCDCGNHN